ncbi:MAG TPA: hypothetical protein ACFYD1_02735 [Candidatus Hypogeohydataceae bacterium YC38]|nr:carboxypeptidase regulatory-like domain-containing protein [Candidatus Brocadiales bacterium]
MWSRPACLFTVTVLTSLFSIPSASAHTWAVKDREIETQLLAPNGYTETSVEKGGVVSGQVRLLTGGTLKDAVVYIKEIPHGKEFTKEIPTLEEKDGVFHPHVLVIPVGGTVELRNTDSEMHNLHSYAQKNASFNEGIPSQGEPIYRRFNFPEIVKIGCDIHREMSAWIVVRDNPYYSITGEEGGYEISNIPPGQYKLGLWHESLQREGLASLTTLVEVEPEKGLEVDFYLASEK